MCSNFKFQWIDLKLAVTHLLIIYIYTQIMCVGLKKMRKKNVYSVISDTLMYNKVYSRNEF